MASNSRSLPFGSDNDQNLSNLINNNTMATAHELQLLLRFGQQQEQNHTQSCNNPETVTFLGYPPPTTGGSDTNSNRNDKREKKRERDLRYRQKEKQIRLQHKEEIQRLRKQNATLEENLRKYRENEDHMGREIAGYKEKALQLEAEVVQLKSTLNSHTRTAEVAAGQCDGSNDVDLGRRYEECKRENALLKKQLKKVKREKKVMEKALLERIMKLESMEKQAIEPSSSYTHSDHSNM